MHAMIKDLLKPCLWPMYYNKLAAKVPRMRTEFGRKSFSVSAANVFSKLPILTRQLDSRVLFRSNLDDLYTCM